MPSRVFGNVKSVKFTIPMVISSMATTQKFTLSMYYIETKLVLILEENIAMLHSRAHHIAKLKRCHCSGKTKL